LPDNYPCYRFDAFMEKALYHPQKGYYSARIHDIGRSGDFSTSASLSTHLAQAIASEITSYLYSQKAPVKKHLNIIECGAGNGKLMQEVIQSLSWRVKRKLRFHIIEVSEPLQKKQQERLKKQSVWHKNIIDALETCQGEAFIYHNEFVDAFPVRVFRSHDNILQELFLKKTNTTIAEHWQPTLPEDLTAYKCSAVETLKAIPRKHTETQELGTIEVPLSYYHWLENLSRHWKKGRMLTIDYGDTFPEVYHQKPNGTLRGYFKHQLLQGSDVFQNPGHQDITYDVNFTDIIHWGESLGIKNHMFTTQREFLQTHLSDTDSYSLIDTYLTNKEGAGAAFKILLQEIN